MSVMTNTFRAIIIAIIVAFSYQIGLSQAQLLVSYSDDCSTITPFHKIVSFGGISAQGFYAYNATDKIYYYLDSDSIYGVSVETGLVVQEVSLNNTLTGQFTFVSRMIYSERLSRLLTVSEQRLTLINPVDGTIELVGDSNLAYNGGAAEFSYMERDSIIAITMGGGLDRNLFIVDDKSGEILYQNDFDFIDNEDIQHHAFDQTTGKLYGVVRNLQASTFNFVEINIQDGSLRRIGDTHSDFAFSGTSTIDEANQHYIYLGSYNGDWWLTKIDLITGEVIKNQEVQLTGSTDRVDDIAYDDATQTLYSKHWDPDYQDVIEVDEICDNGIDDDGDGAVDCDDSDLADDCCCKEALTIEIPDYEGCEGQSITITATSTNFSGPYVWELDGNIIQNTSATLIATEAGTYTAFIMDDCSQASASSVVTFGSSFVRMPDTHTACMGEVITLRPETNATTLTWFFNGLMIQNYNELWLDVTGSAVIRAVADFGSDCEVAAETAVTFMPTTTTSETYYLCQGETVTVDGLIYTSPGVFIIDIPNGDCSNVRMFEIIEIPMVTLEETFTVCENELVRVQGLDYMLPGRYTLRNPDEFGCDTIYKFTIVHLPVPMIEKTIYLEEGRVEFNGVTYDAPGQYVQNVPSPTGCDTSCVLNVFQGSCLVSYDFDACNSSVTLGNNDYSEMFPTYPQSLSCGTLIATEFFRESPAVNTHSCTSGLDGTSAICISSDDSCDFVLDSEQAGRIRMIIDPEAGNEVLLTRLVFSQMAPVTYNWSHSSGLNNYPTKFGLRILVDGIAVFQRTEMNTTLDWTQVEFNLNENAIPIASSSMVVIEILGYCKIGNGAAVSAFDLENIKIFGGCQSATANKMIAGKVSLGLEEEAMEDVEVRSEGGDLFRYSMTSAEGKYAFGQSNEDMSYRLTAHKDVNHLQGVSTLDLIAIQRHILGIEELNYPLQKIAADINNDNVINGVDLVELRKLILGIYEEFPENESYRFFDRTSVIESKDVVTLDNKVILQAGPDHQFGVDFVGVKIGDVIGQSLTSRSNQSLFLEIQDAAIMIGERVEVPVLAKDLDDLLGFQTTLGFDASVMQFIEINGAALDMTDNNLGLHDVSSGALSLSWNDMNGIDAKDGEVLFVLVFDVINNGNLASSIQMNSSRLSQEAYVSGLETIPLQLNFKSIVAQSAFTMYPSSPNPFKNRTEVKFSLPGSSDVDYSLYDVNGKVILKSSVFYESGTHSLILDSYNLNTSGVMYLKLETAYGAATQKLVLVE